MEIATRCFKIDRPNAFAMISGYYKNGRLNRQAIWCAVTAPPFPMLITLQRSPTPFRVSEVYRLGNVEEFSMPYKYIACLDSEYPIKNDIGLWQKVCTNGLFDIWDPIAPYSRFADCKSDPSRFRIQLLRVYEIAEEFDKADVVPLSSRVDKLTTKRTVTIKEPVISDEEFLRIKSLLKESVLGFMSY
jgi:hypothetical protein